jgi:threonylcarbamoyladenosine tRNA methylthiotransferase MtaB
MPQLAPGTAKERAERLRAKGAAALRRHLDTEVGRVRQVLTESDNLGRTEHATPVRLAGMHVPGMIVDLRIAGHDGRHLLAA